MPDEWGIELTNEGLYLVVNCINSKGSAINMSHSIAAYINTFSFQPLASIPHPIHIPLSFWTPAANTFPIKVEVELLGATAAFKFDVTLVYDESTG